MQIQFTAPKCPTQVDFGSVSNFKMAILKLFPYSGKLPLRYIYNFSVSFNKDLFLPVSCTFQRLALTTIDSELTFSVGRPDFWLVKAKFKKSVLNFFPKTFRRLCK